MSDFKFNCPKCGQNIVCDTSNAGMQIPCPACQTVLTVPAPAPAAAPASKVPGVPAPGKLSINKAAHAPAPQPAPGAAKAPAPAAQPAWGTKPAPVANKKKFPVAMVSVIAGIVVVGAIGWFGFGAPYLKKQAEEKAQAEQAEKDRIAAEAKAKAEAAAKAKRAQAEWNLDLTDIKFPERAASGTLHGDKFAPEVFLFANGVLTIRQTNGATKQLQIPVHLNPGEKLNDKKIQVASTDTTNVARIVMNWKEESPKPPGMQVFAKGYALKLEFGELADANIPGKIFLSLPDDAQSFVAGNFELGPRKLGAAPVAGAPRPKRSRPSPGTQPPPK